MKHTSIAILMAAFLSAGLAGVSLPAQADKDEDECKDKKECPLHAWMEANMQPAMEKRDMEKLAGLLEKVAELAPKKEWNKGKNGWKKLAEDGAAAARKGRKGFRDLRKSCKTCHDVWRDKYKAQFRDKKLPKNM